MRFDLIHKIVTYIYAGLGLLIVSISGDVHYAVRAIVWGLAVLSWLGEGRFIHEERYQRIMTSILIGVIGIQIIRVFSDASIFTILVETTMLFQISRLWQRRSAAEYQQITALAFLQLLVSALVDSGVTYALVFFCFVVTTPWVMALTYLRLEIERKQNLTNEPASQKAKKIRIALRSRDLATKRFLFGSAALAFPLFLVTATFFLLFPRVGSGFLNIGARRTESVAGFGDQITLGGFGTIRDDPSVVIRVFPPELSNTPPVNGHLRLRGTAFYNYNGTEWSHSSVRRQEVRASFGYHIFSEIYNYDQIPRMRIVAEPLDGPIVFLPEGAAAIRFSSKWVQGLETPVEVIRADGFEIRLKDERTTTLDYQVLLNQRIDVADSKLSDQDRERALQIPSDHERVVALARSLVEGAQSDHDKANRILSYLKNSGRYRYSLTLTSPQNEPPLVHFLFSQRSGHCEYFSTAFAIMLRAVGIPTRNVTGFLGGTYNSFGRYYALRQGDAHSWVEAWIDGAFHTYDPTPSSRDEVVIDQGWTASLRAFIDAVRIVWVNDIVGYDFAKQRDLFRSLIRRKNHHTPSEGVDVNQPVQAYRQWLSMGSVWIIILIVLVIIIFIRKKKNQVLIHPVVKLYQELDQILIKSGYPRPKERTPKEHVHVLESVHFSQVAIVRQVTELYSQVRYVGAEINEKEIKKLHKLIKKINRQSN